MKDMVRALWQQIVDKDAHDTIVHSTKQLRVL
jgi:hypothetical protein